MDWRSPCAYTHCAIHSAACSSAQGHGFVHAHAGTHHAHAGTHTERNPSRLQGQAGCKSTQREAQFQILWHISCSSRQPILNLRVLFNCCFPWRESLATYLFLWSSGNLCLLRHCKELWLIKELIQNEACPSVHLFPPEGEGTRAGQTISWTGATQPLYYHISGKTAHV